jgi:hypothetical protein
VLFSRADVALFISANFEPTWEMVRPVPIIRIDFGNNQVITRTLHGNIATYVCTAAGDVLDVLPGIYAPRDCLRCLDQFRLLANYVNREGPGRQASRLRAYHENQALALRNNKPPDVLVNTAGLTKAVIERSARTVLAELVPAGNVAGARGRYPRGNSVGDDSRANSQPDQGEDLANWKLLQEDTQLNETVRRRQIHEMLAEKGLVRPEIVVKRIYKEVLHTDLDDAYLGLGEALFANYPFAKEDERQ